MSQVTLSLIFLIVSYVLDLSYQQFVSSCHKGRDCILILLESFTTSDTQMCSCRICFLETRWLISTINHITSLSSISSDFLLSWIYLFGFQDNFFFAKYLTQFFHFFVFFLFPPLKILILLKISSENGSLLLVKVGSTKNT